MLGLGLRVNPIDVGLYTILLLPMLYFEWQQRGGRWETIYCSICIAKYNGGGVQ